MSIYNEDELEAPAWLDKEFLQNVLRNYEKEEKLEVIDMTITPATLKGDHFASCMFRAKVQYRTIRNTKIDSRSLIIKTLPEADSAKGEMLTGSQVFETEISVYTEAIPKIEQILAEYGDCTRFGPKVIYTSVKPTKIIIFEDLCEKGYDAIRGRYLNMDELKEVLRKLAKFHAVSYKIGKSNQSEDVTKYKEGLFNNSKWFESDMLSGGIKRFKRVLESCEDLRIYLPQFEGIEGDVKQGCIDLYNAHKNGEESDIFVLNHGDFHLRNLMFEFNEENCYKDVMMVDFQLSVFGPSIIDLTYATYMLFDPVQRLEKHDEIMRFYFETFIATLKNIDFQGKLPSYGQLRMSSLKHRCFTVYLLSTVLPMIFMMANAKAEDLKDFDITEDVIYGDNLMATYMSPAFIEELKRLLPVLLNKGYLD